MPYLRRRKNIHHFLFEMSSPDLVPFLILDLLILSQYLEGQDFYIQQGKDFTENVDGLESPAEPQKDEFFGALRITRITERVNGQIYGQILNKKYLELNVRVSSVAVFVHCESI